MTVLEMRAKKEELIKECREILEKESATPEERAANDARLVEIEDLQRRIDALTKLDAADAAANRSANNIASIIKVGDRRGARKPYANLGEQLIDGRMAAFGQGESRAAARERLENVEDEYRTISGMSETVPSDGGFLVQTDISTAMLKRAYGAAKIPGKCLNVPISSLSNSLKMPYFDETSRATGSRFGAIQIYSLTEGVEPTAKKPKIGMLELNLKKIGGLAYITEELSMDAPAMTAIYEQAFEQEFAFVFDDSCIRGNGAGYPLGILNSDALATVAASGAANTVLWEDIVQMGSQMYSGCFDRAEWYVNNNVLPQLWKMSMAVGTGGVPVYLPPGGASASPYGSLLGRPVNVMEQCSALSTVGDIIFADFSQYIWATKGALNSAISSHVRFIYGEDTIRWMVRIDGQPGWHSTLTPYKDRSTSEPVSPFVALATRS